MTRRQIDGPSKQEVVEIVKQNPTLDAHTIVKRFNCDLGRVNHARSELGLAQKRPFVPRPRLSQDDTKKVVANLRSEIDNLRKENAILSGELMKGDSAALIAELRGVIKYLERKLGEANGSSV
jgi:hypothetical protein